MSGDRYADDDDRAPEAEYHEDRRRFMRMIYLSVGFVLVMCVGAFAMLVNRFDPCGGIDWMADYTSISKLDQSHVSQFWPSIEEFETLKADNSAQISARSREFEDIALKGVQNNCLLIDWTAMAEGEDVTRNNFIKAIIQPPSVERLDDIALTGTTRRIAVRSSLFARECRITDGGPKEPSGVVLIKELSEIYSKEQLIESTMQDFDPRSVVETNSDVYLVSLISPKNYFAAADTVRYLVEIDGQTYLYNLFFDNTRDNIKNYNKGSVVMTEIIKLDPLREKINRAHARCTASGQPDPAPASEPISVL